MNFKNIATIAGLAAGAAIALTSTSAQAATLWATDILDTDGNSLTDGSFSSGSRDDADAALGAPDGEFFEIPEYQSVIASFGQEFSGPGSIYEITFGSVANWPEAVKIDVIFDTDGIGNEAEADWTTVNPGSITNLSAQGGALFDFTGTFNYMRITDLAGSPTDGQGFDIDAIGVSPVGVPEPASAVGLLLFGVFGAKTLAGRFTEA